MDVQFPNNSQPTQIPRQKATLSDFLVAKGIVKTTSQANMLMLIAVVILLAIAFFIATSGSNTTLPDDTAPEDNPDLIL